MNQRFRRKCQDDPTDRPLNQSEFGVIKPKLVRSSTKLWRGIRQKVVKERDKRGGHHPAHGREHRWKKRRAYFSPSLGPIMWSNTM